MIRSLLAITSQNNWIITRMDIITTFFHGPCKEEVYVKHPEGFLVPGKEHLVYRLKKALYGLRQAPKLWYDEIDHYLKHISFKPGMGDHNLYSRIENLNIVLLAL